jgi:hypothetical protein
MILRSVLAAAGAVAALGLAGAGHAAAAPVGPTVALAHPDLVYAIVPDGLSDGPATTYYQLIIDPAWTQPTRFAAFPTQPGTTAAYALRIGTDASAAPDSFRAPLAGRPQANVPAGSQAPLLTQLLNAGQHVLQIDTLAGQLSASTQMTAVPLPGAIWLFGSALLAFLGISSRRRL